MTLYCKRTTVFSLKNIFHVDKKYSVHYIGYMGIKERKTKLFVALVLLGDLSHSPVTFNEDIQRLFDISLNPKTKATFRSLEKKGLVSQVTTETSEEKSKAKEVTYRLTEDGYEALCLEFPYFRFLKNTWDGKWRILSYEIPEKKREMRDRLRREVSGWGLGPWHRSFWVTPHPIIPQLQTLISNKDEEKYVQAFESDHVVGNRDVLIEKVWGTKELAADYKKLFKKWHDILSTDQDKIAKMMKVTAEYVSVLRKDPGLPKELVGESWIGFESFSIFKEVRGILLSK